MRVGVQVNTVQQPFRFAEVRSLAIAAEAAGLSAAGTVLSMANPPADPVLAVALTVTTLVFGVAAILLLRPRR